MSSKENDHRYKVDGSDGVAAKKITALNDDCLSEIFRYLTFEDLCAVKGSHERFAWSVNRVFKLKYLDSCGTLDVHTVGANYNHCAQMIEFFSETITDVFFALRSTPEKNETRKYFTLLNLCSAMEHLTLQGYDLDYVLTDLPVIKIFENLSSLNINYCHVTEAPLKLILSACNPLKLISLKFTDQFNVSLRISDDLRAFIADRMFHLEHLEFGINECTSSLHENLSKLQNLQKLTTARIMCEEMAPIAPILRAMTNIDSLEVLEICDCSNIVPNENVVEAINKMSNVAFFVYSTRKEILEVEKMTKFKQMNYEYCFSFLEHKYIFNR